MTVCGGVVGVGGTVGVMVGRGVWVGPGVKVKVGAALGVAVTITTGGADSEQAARATTHSAPKLAFNNTVQFTDRMKAHFTARSVLETMSF